MPLFLCDIVLHDQSSVKPSPRADCIKLVNDLINNVNVNGNINGFNISAPINTNTSLFTPSTDGITILEDGIYEFSINMYMNSNDVRTCPGYRFTIDGTPIGSISASSYIRDASGHNESSSNLEELFEITAGQKIGVQTLLLANVGTVTLPASESSFIIKRI